jgi:hypothetical protein
MQLVLVIELSVIDLELELWLDGFLVVVVNDSCVRLEWKLWGT